MKRNRLRGISVLLTLSMLFGMVANLVAVPSASAIVSPTVQSPVFNEDGSVTVSVTSVTYDTYVNGNFVNWNDGNFKPLLYTGQTDDSGTAMNVLSYTFTKDDLNKTNGKLEYKFFQGANWNHGYADVLNKSSQSSSGDSIVHYMELESATAQLKTGETLTLKASRYLGDNSKVDLTADAIWSSDSGNVTVAGGVVTAAADAVVGSKVNISAAYKGVTVKKEITVADATNDGNWTFRYSNNSSKLFVVGSFNNWDNTGIEMTKGQDGYFTKTLYLGPGKHEYKYVPVSKSWGDAIGDPVTGGNMVVILTGIAMNISSVIKGDTVQLKGTLYNDQGNGTAVSPIWSLKQPVSGVSIQDDMLTISPVSTLKDGDTFVLVATKDGVSSEKTLTVVDRRISAALMDSFNTILTTTSLPLIESDLSTFKLIDKSNGDQQIPVTALKLGDNKVQLTLSDTSLFDIRHLYQVSNNRFHTGNVTMRNVLDDSKYYYSGSDLGVTYTSIASTFKIWAPTAVNVTLKLYADATTADDSGTDQMMVRADNGVWSTEVNQNLAEKYYKFKISFANGTETFALDPYAKASSVNSAKSAIIDLSTTNPVGWNPSFKPPTMNVNATDAVIYELHTRDFSMDENSSISANNRGKFNAFTETGTTLPGHPEIKTGIDHLEELGITHVQLLPFYDFGVVDETKVDDPSSTERKFNWGYDPVNFNVPEGSYATQSAVEDPAKRIKELKAMIQALHNKGIRIVLDVVYNHTYQTGQTGESDEMAVFDKVVPGYYYRTDDTGIYTNGSGVNNDVASERPMVRKYIEDSVKYLAEQYNVDGFRFDLFALIDTPTMKHITNELKDQVDPAMIVYGEPWTGGTTALPGSMQTLKGSQKDTNFAVFNDNFRSAIKGDSDGGGKGFATGEAGKEADIVKGVRGSIDDFTNSPNESINYVTVHDNLNLWDKVLATRGIDAKINPFATLDAAQVMNNETVKRSLLANAIVMTSQGVPLFNAGDEFLRSKFGDHNSYASSDEINKLRWTQKQQYKPVFDYYKGLIELRKSHPAFRMSTKAAVNQNLQVLKQSGNVVSFQLKNFANGDKWRNIVVVYNANSSTSTVQLPSASNWNVVVDQNHAGVTPLRSVNGKSVEVAGLSMMVLYDQESNITPIANSISVNPNEVGMNPGSSKYASANVKDQTGAAMMNQTVTWTSSNEAVASVGSTGKITAIANGTAVITAAIGSVKGTMTVHVEKLVPTTISVTGDNSVYTTRMVQLSALVKDQFNQEMTGATVRWVASDTHIASVDASGKVTGQNEGSVSITASAGSEERLITAVKQINVKPYVKRYIEFHYVRPDQDYKDWNLWVWNTGVKNDQIDFEKVENGTNVVHIEIAPGTTRVGFVLRKGTDWGTAKQDIPGDRFVIVNPDDSYTKVFVTSMVNELNTLPSVQGPELSDGNIFFYYRDDALFESGQMSDITAVQVKINGQIFPMTYNNAVERFSYTMSDAQDGTYTYSFLVTKSGQTNEITDPKNTVGGISKVIFHKPLITVNAAVTPGEISYDQNAVLSLQTSSSEPINIKEMYVDLSPLGGLSKVAIDTELQAITLAVTQNTPTGIRNLVVTVVDEYGNKTLKTVPIRVKSKQVVGGSLDFDWDEARIYFMLTDRFSDGDSTNNKDVNKEHPEAYHGGDFQGIINKIDYLQNLGINTIWISPIVDNVEFNKGEDFNSIQYAYHGYWAKNFTQIDEHFGDLNKFKELIDKAHDRGIKIMVDVVLNHAGYGVKEGDNRDGITQADKDRFAGMLRTGGAQSNDVQGELAGLPDFLTENPAVRAKLIEWQTDWLSRATTDRGNTIDYFRVDTVSNVENTTWKAFKNALTKINPTFKMIGEYYGASLDNNGGNLKSGQMDSVLDFEFKGRAEDFVKNGNVDGVEAYLEDRDTKINNTAMMGQFLSSHDESGFLSEIVGNDEGKLKVAAALQITSKGQPVIYYGEELGQSGKVGGDFSNGEFSENRKDMPWDKLSDPKEKALHDHYQTLLQIRAKYSKVISKGIRTKLAGSNDDGYLVFAKNYEGQNVVIGLNTTKTAKTVKFTVPFAAGTSVVDAYSDKVLSVDSDKKVTIQLPSRDDGGTIILVPYVGSPDSSGPSGPTGGAPTMVSQDTLIVPSDSLKKDKEGKVSIEIEQGKKEILVSIEAIQSLEADKLEFKQGDLTVQMPAQVLKAIQRLIPADQATEAQFSLHISEVNMADAQELLKNLVHKEGENVKPAGKVYEFTLTAVNKEGKSFKLERFEEPVTLTFTVNPGSNQDLLGIYYIIDAGKLEYVGGILNNGVITTDVFHFSKYAVLEYNKTYQDVKADHWAAQVIQTLSAKHIIDGASDHSFAPEQQVTRAQFTTMLVRALGLKTTGSANFTDVKATEWYAEAVAAANALGIVSGREEHTFAPNDAITREEMAAMIVRSYEIKTGKKAATAAKTAFIDEALISDWAESFVKQAIGAGLLHGRDKSLFAPQGHTTRAESAQAIYNLLNSPK